MCVGVLVMVCVCVCVPGWSGCGEGRVMTVTQ